MTPLGPRFFWAPAYTSWWAPMSTGTPAMSLERSATRGVPLASGVRRYSVPKIVLLLV